MKRANSDLRISSFSDREILAVMSDLSGQGGVLASDLAARLFGLKPDEDGDVKQHAARCVTSRLTWMKRYGLIESEKPTKENRNEATEWSISKMGLSLRFTPIGRALSSAISNTPGGSVLELTHQVSERMLREGDVEARAMRREFQHQITRRRWR